MLNLLVNVPEFEACWCMIESNPTFRKNKNIMLETQEQYSPSKWSPRMKEDVIVGAHIKEVFEKFLTNFSHAKFLCCFPY